MCGVYGNHHLGQHFACHSSRRETINIKSEVGILGQPDQWDQYDNMTALTHYRIQPMFITISRRFLSLVPSRFIPQNTSCLPVRHSSNWFIDPRFSPTVSSPAEPPSFLPPPELPSRFHSLFETLSKSPFLDPDTLVVLEPEQDGGQFGIVVTLRRGRQRVKGAVDSIQKWVSTSTWSNLRSVSSRIWKYSHDSICPTVDKKENNKK
jgi:hypothetical protein